MPSVLVFDIETRALQLTGPLEKALVHKVRNVLPDNRAKKMLDYRYLHPAYAEVAAISVLRAASENAAREECVEAVIVGDEEDILRTFINYIDDFNGLFVTFNGFGFDIPFIIARCAVYGIQIRNSRFLMLAKFRSAPHYDVMALLGNWGTFPVSLQEASLMFDVVNSKDYLEGEDILKFLQRATSEELSEYCKGDTWTTWCIFQKMYLIYH